MTDRVTLKELKNREREARVNLLIDAAERVFATKPFDKVSMREIANEAGMAPSTIYRYFPNQEALFVESVVRDHNRLIENFREAVSAADKSHGNRIRAVIETFFRFIIQNDSYFSMMTILMSHGNLSPESSDRVIEVMKRTLDLLDSLFNSMGYMENTRKLSRYFSSTLIGAVVAYRKLPGRSQDKIESYMNDVGRYLEESVMRMIEGSEPPA